MKKVQQGFTLIELMIVVAIIGILAAVAIPAYQDYTIRAKVTEALGLASSAKTSVSEYYISLGTMPADQTESGFDELSSPYVASMVYSGGGVIRVTLANDIGGAANSTTLLFSGTGTTGKVTWTCTGGTLDAKYRPANCR